MFKSLVPHRKRTNLPVRSERSAPNIAELQDRFDSLVNQFWNDPNSIWDDTDPWTSGWGCDVEDSDKELVVRAEAPGFEPDEIDIEMSGDRLVLKAEHREETKKNGGTYHSTFYRSMTLPKGIEADQINAEYKNGVLEVHLPKGPEAKAKRIPVKAK